MTWGRISEPTGQLTNDADAASKLETQPMSVIGPDIVVTGNIDASVDLLIEGRVVGDVRCNTLILGEGSSIKGGVYAARVKVAGKVNGAVETGDLAVEANGAVSGKISYQRLRVANGGILQGRISRKARPERSDEPGQLKLVKARTARAAPKPSVE